MRKALKKGLLKAAFTVAASAGLVGLCLAAAPIPGLMIGYALAPPVAMGLYSLAMCFQGKEKGEADLKSLPSGVPLTADEIALIKSIFGKRIAMGDLKRVRKYLIPEANEDTAAQVHGLKRIDFFTPKHHEADYSQSKDVFNYATFIHEMAHIWQRQRLISMERQRKRGPQSGDKYSYMLSAKSRFRDFGTEQQASIIADYVRRFIYPDSYQKSRRLAGGDTPESDALLQRVVEKKFRAARKTRLRLEPVKKAQTEERAKNLELAYNAASGVSEKLTALCDRPGSTFKYDIEESASGEQVYFRTNVPCESSDGDKEAVLWICAAFNGFIGVWENGQYVQSTQWSANLSVDYIARKAAEKGLTKVSAPKAMGAMACPSL